VWIFHRVAAGEKTRGRWSSPQVFDARFGLYLFIRGERDGVNGYFDFYDLIQ
jgi:hypothetical protein